MRGFKLDELRKETTKELLNMYYIIKDQIGHTKQKTERQYLRNQSYKIFKIYK